MSSYRSPQFKYMIFGIFTYIFTFYIWNIALEKRVFWLANILNSFVHELHADVSLLTWQFFSSMLTL